MALQRGKLLAVIGDEDTVVGFMLGGIGQLNKARKPNYFIVDKNTAVTEIEEVFKASFLAHAFITLLTFRTLLLVMILLLF
jgi:V-type H+-transporting ATPase subunit F